MFPWASGALEPALPRKKKYPDSAYRSNQLLKNLEYPGAPNQSGCGDATDGTVPNLSDFRARSEERTFGKLLSGTRSRSADPSLGRRRPQLMTQSYPPPSSTQQLNECAGHGGGGGGGGVPKTTEYRSQFAWPPASAVLLASEARKSLSMGAIAPPAATHHAKGEEPNLPDGPVVTQNEEEETPRNTRKNKVTEYKAKFRPFSSYLYVDGNWRKSNKNPTATAAASESEPLDETNAWYTEVVERLKKADEYRSRAHGLPGGVTKSDQPLTDQERKAELWNQIRERNSLVSLTLATSSSSIRPISAERKKSPAVEPKAKTPVENKAAPSAKYAPTRTSRPEEKNTGSGQRVPSAGPSPAGSSNKGSATPTPVIRPRTRGTTGEAPAAANGPEDGKIWMKPLNKANEDGAPEGNAAPAPPEEGTDETKKRQERPCSLPGQVNGAGGESMLNGGQDYPISISGPSPLPEPHVGPVPLTTVRSPEEVTGVKSPDPETWTVPLETNRGLEWMDGHTPEMNRVKSPPLTGPPKGVVTNQPTETPDLPPTPDAVQNKITGEDVVAGPKVENMVASADVLDRARSRLDEFWSKSK